VPPKARAAPAAIGFRVKSGWASVVLVVGPAKAPRVLDRRHLDLADPAVPEARQPYHEGFEAARPNAPSIARLVGVVQRYARRSLAQLVREYRAAGHALRGVGVVVGSEIDPARIPNPHIRAHAAEGELFRTVVLDAARRSGLDTSVVLERNVYATTARQLGKSERQVRGAVGELGREVTGPWRAEEKTAALAAWGVLVQRPRKRRK
jgi:hypothetical protein